MSFISLVKENPVGAVLSCPPPPSFIQDRLTPAISFFTSWFLRTEKIECAIAPHPMQKLYQAAIRKNQQAVESSYYSMPDSLRVRVQEAFAHVTKCKPEEVTVEEIKQSLNPLKRAVKKVAEELLNTLQASQKHAVYGTIYRLAGSPQTDDAKWGESHAKDDTELLLSALHRHHLLHLRGKTLSIWTGLERSAPKASCTYQLHKQELDEGQISFHNGMGASFDQTRRDAEAISQKVAQGYNLHCTYAAKVSDFWDMASAVLGQGGQHTPATVQLLDQWLRFFEKNDDKKLLQICTSRGVVEVRNALKELPHSLQRRIIVITIAPACLIDSSICHKAINLVVPSDPVVRRAANRHLMDDPKTTWKLQPHADNPDPHDLLGASFRKELVRLIDEYIRTNDFTIH